MNRLSQNIVWAISVAFAIVLFIILYTTSYMVKKSQLQGLTEVAKKESAEELKDLLGVTHESYLDNDNLQKSLDSESGWSYFGEKGPKNWFKINENYKPCGEGRFQSPIDIVDFGQKSFEINISYKESYFQMYHNGKVLKLEAEGGNHIVFQSKEYHLKSIEFHNPSEHIEDSIPYPMEVQFNHEDQHGEKLNLAVFIDEGKFNDFVQLMWRDLPKDSNFPKKELKLDFLKLIPKKPSFYAYQGSMTSPPCEEGVQWVVMKSAIKISQKQLEAFEKIFNKNNRPVQKNYSPVFFAR